MTGGSRRRPGVAGTVTEQTHDPHTGQHADDPVDDGRADEDRGISDMGLPRPGDDAPDDSMPADGAATEAALDEAFPPQDAGRA